MNNPYHCNITVNNKSRHNNAWVIDYNNHRFIFMESELFPDSASISVNNYPFSLIIDHYIQSMGWYLLGTDNTDFWQQVATCTVEDIAHANSQCEVAQLKSFLENAMAIQTQQTHCPLYVSNLHLSHNSDIPPLKAPSSPSP